MRGRVGRRPGGAADGMKRLLVCSIAECFGGAEVFLVNLVRGLGLLVPDLEINAVVAPSRLAEALGGVGQIRGIRTVSHSLRHGRAFRQACLETLDNHEPYILLNGNRAIYLGALLLPSWAVRVGVQHTVFDTEVAGRFRRRVRLMFLRRLYNRLDHLIAVSQAVLAPLAALEYQQPASVVPNAIDTLYFTPGTDRDRCEARAAWGIPPDALVLVQVARLSIRTKRQDLALRAVARLHNPNVHLLLAGEGPDRAELERLARNMGLADRVRFLGQVDVLSVYHAADMLCLTSDFESMPIVLLEARACGLPVVATRVGGVPEVVKDGIDGLLFQPGDPADLADRLERLATDPELRNSVTRAGRERVLAHHQLEVMSRKVWDILGSLPS